MWSRDLAGTEGPAPRLAALMWSRDFSPGTPQDAHPTPAAHPEQPTISQMPVLSLSDLSARIAADRAAGRTVALANGCFDILHVGAVNDDASVRTLKGAGRPIMSASDRAELVAAVRRVDYVVVFGGATVEEVLQAVKPD